MRKDLVVSLKEDFFKFWPQCIFSADCLMDDDSNIVVKANIGTYYKKNDGGGGGTA